MRNNKRNIASLKKDLKQLSMALNVALIGILIGVFSIHFNKVSELNSSITEKNASIQKLQKNVDNLSKVPVLNKAQEFYDPETKENNPCSSFEDLNVFCELNWKYSDTAPRNRLISQVPDKGASSKKVVLTYSLGSNNIVLPDFVGNKINEVEKQIESLDLIVGPITRISIPNFSKDTIVQTFPASSSSLKAGDTVYLVVSDKTLINVPDWTGKTKEYVQADADSLGVKVKFVEKESSEINGTVLSQNLVGNQSMDKEIVVTIAKAKKNVVEIPELIGKTKEEAITELSLLGFMNISLEYKETDSSNKVNEVVKVNPKEGTEMDVNDKVTITLSGSK